VERAPDGRVLVVADTNVLINFLRAARLDLVSHHRDYKLVVTEHARGEVTYPEQSAELATALSAGDIDEVQLTDPVELGIFAGLNAVLGRGESAAIAVAANRNWVIAMDELGRARREAYGRVGRNRLINTPGLVLSCIRNGDITVAEADALKEDLESQGQSFAMSFNSFGELL
jgi:predicted nucleic acid-binding protein